MQISEIRPGMTVDVKARVLGMQPPRTVRSKRGKMLKVSEAMLGDPSGRIPLTLWQRQIFLIKVGQVIEIKNAYTSEFQGITRITLGRSGTLTVVDDPSFPSINELLKDLQEDTQT
ncbi:MAG: hypothetical protein HWN65_00870 [Candidatus Helarchaeota archaeon]|nr:hypothetical protein [Candidatus Helarchaeota archaeon]